MSEAWFGSLLIPASAKLTPKRQQISGPFRSFSGGGASSLFRWRWGVSCLELIDIPVVLGGEGSIEAHRSNFRYGQLLSERDSLRIVPAFSKHRVVIGEILYLCGIEPDSSIEEFDENFLKVGGSTRRGGEVIRAQISEDRSTSGERWSFHSDSEKPGSVSGSMPTRSMKTER